jgi:hypothetical protein
MKIFEAIDCSINIKSIILDNMNDPFFKDFKYINKLIEFGLINDLISDVLI